MKATTRSDAVETSLLEWVSCRARNLVAARTVSSVTGRRWRLRRDVLLRRKPIDSAITQRKGAAFNSGYLQVSRYLRQFPSPCSPNLSLLRQAALRSAHTSRGAGLRQVSRYVRQLPSPRSPSLSLFSQASRNCSHCPPRRPSTRTPPGPISIDWEKPEIGKTKRARVVVTLSTSLRISHPSICGINLITETRSGSGQIWTSS